MYTLQHYYCIVIHRMFVIRMASVIVKCDLQCTFNAQILNCDRHFDRIATNMGFCRTFNAGKTAYSFFSLFHHYFFQRDNQRSFPKTLAICMPMNDRITSVIRPIQLLLFMYHQRFLSSLIECLFFNTACALLVDIVVTRPRNRRRRLVGRRRRRQLND